MGMAVASSRRHGVREEINITPLIDVVLVLLIIFMVLVPSSLKQLTADIPRKAETTQQEQVTQTVLKLGPGGELALNDEAITRADLPDKIKPRIFADLHRLVFFEVADGVPYGEVVELMDLVKGLGARRLGIVTRP